MTKIEAADRATGQKQLRRLETFLDVAYAVLFVEFIMFLPVTEDMAWTDLRFGLLSLLWDNSLDLLRLIIAVGLVLISWNLTPQAAWAARPNQWVAHPSESVAIDFRLSIPVLCDCRPNTGERLVARGPMHLPRDLRFHRHCRLAVRAQERLCESRAYRGSAGRGREKCNHRTGYRLAEHRPWVRGSGNVDARLVRDSSGAGWCEATAGTSQVAFGSRTMTIRDLGCACGCDVRRVDELHLQPSRRPGEPVLERVGRHRRPAQATPRPRRQPR